MPPTELPSPSALAHVETLYAEGLLSEARAACHVLLANEPHDARAHAAAGMLALKLGDAEAAEAHYRAAVQHDPSFADAYFNWGNVLAKQGRREAAELSGGPSQCPCRRRRAPHAVRPREGLLLLFPSYFYHRTLPFRADAPRISVAFDAVPLASVPQ